MVRSALMVSTALAAIALPGTAIAAQDPAGASAPISPATATATEGAAANTSPDSQDSGGEVIVVTAQKRTQLLIEVPQSISVISGSTLEQQHADNFSDYLKLVPGLQLNQDTPGQGRLVIRGVNTGGVASTVGVYMDETPFGSSSGLVNASVLAGDFDTFDLDRIEVLRGPQGTIYGASSLGGVLKFITRLPSTTARVVRGRFGIETTDGGGVGYFGNAAVNLPLSDTLAVRASGTYRKYAGFIDSIGTGGSDREKNINDSVSYGGRVSLLFKPSSNASLRLTAVAQDIKADAPSLIESNPDNLKRLYGRLSQSQFVPQFSNVKYRVYNGAGIFDLGFGELTTSTSYSTQKQTFRTDYTNALSPLVGLIFSVPNEFFLGQNTDSKKFTQEIRLSGEGRLLDWLVGGYYTDEKGLIDQEFVAVEPGTLTPIASLPVLGVASIRSKYKEFAGFANATVHLGDRFDLDLGGRYSRNEQSANQRTGGALAGSSNLSTRSDEDVFTYSVAPRFELSKNASIYARVAKGFRPGGPNVVPPGAPASVATYKSDSTINYEAGIKAQTDDNRFSVDAAIFHIDWKDVQLFATIDGFGVNANGGGAKVDGGEVTFTARPSRGLNLSANGAYTNARLSKDTEIGGLKGDRLPFTPRFSAALNGDYNWPLTDAIQARVGASLRHLSSQSGAFDAIFREDFGRQRRLRAYQVVDLSAGLDFGRFSLDAYAKNLGNSAGRTSTTGTKVFGAFSVFPGGAIGTGVIRPRTFGLSLTAGL